MTKLTYEEETELRYLALRGFNYLVRNEKGTVQVFVNQPHKEKSAGGGYDTWCERSYPMSIEEQKRRQHTEIGNYDFVTWESEPLLISNLITH